MWLWLGGPSLMTTVGKEMASKASIDYVAVHNLHHLWCRILTSS